MTGIPCPRCGRTDRWQVIDSRPANGSIRRRRQCSCGLRVTTHEVLIEQLDELRGMHDSIVELHRVASEALKTATLFQEKAQLAFRTKSATGETAYQDEIWETITTVGLPSELVPA